MHKVLCLCLFFVCVVLIFLAAKCFGPRQTSNPQKLEGESCGTLDGQEWTCQKQNSCQVFPTLVQKGWVLTCSNEGEERVVCCPRPEKSVKTNVLTTKPPSISERKCQEYQAALCSSRMGNLRPIDDYSKKDLTEAFPGLIPDKVVNENMIRAKRQLDDDTGSAMFDDEDIFDDDRTESSRTVTVFNGVPATSGEFPHAALVGYSSKRSWLCGGTLISDRFILSAAHCANHETLGPAKWVRLGDLDHSIDDDNTMPQDFFIVNRFVHPNYSKELVYNDIALFRLDHPAVFNQFVAPACIYSLPSDIFGTVTVAGWGRIGRQLAENTRLLKTDLNVIETNECKTRVTNSETLPSGVDGETMICAWAEGKDACRGDSGGPLTLTNSPHCLGHLVGITSFGPDRCDRSPIPGIYTRVSAFLPWLEPIVWSQSI